MLKAMGALEKKVRRILQYNAAAKCLICLMALKDPEATPCGHVFCDQCLARWLKEHDTCPACWRNVRQDDEKSVNEEIGEAMRVDSEGESEG